MGERVEPGPGQESVWDYPRPPRLGGEVPAFAPLAGTVAFYPGRMDKCRLDGEVVVRQPGDFYGGWITSRVVGPFKGLWHHGLVNPIIPGRRRPRPPG